MWRAGPVWGIYYGCLSLKLQGCGDPASGSEKRGRGLEGMEEARYICGKGEAHRNENVEDTKVLQSWSNVGKIFTRTGARKGGWRGG